MSDQLYEVKVKGGGRFVYDTIDVGRFAIAMAKANDNRPFVVKPYNKYTRNRCGICDGRIWPWNSVAFNDGKVHAGCKPA